MKDKDDDGITRAWNYGYLVGVLKGMVKTWHLNEDVREFLIKVLKEIGEYDNI